MKTKLYGVIDKTNNRMVIVFERYFDAAIYMENRIAAETDSVIKESGYDEISSKFKIKAVQLRYEIIEITPGEEILFN